MMTENKPHTTQIFLEWTRICHIAGYREIALGEMIRLGTHLSIWREAFHAVDPTMHMAVLMQASEVAITKEDWYWIYQQTDKWHHEDKVKSGKESYSDLRFHAARQIRLM